MRSFTYKGKVYRLDEKFFDESDLNSSVEFNLRQYQFLIEQQDWVTLENRIVGGLLWGGLVEEGS